MRREFLTGFFGSAGTAVVTVDKAILWTHGQYHVQADHQIDCNWILMNEDENVGINLNIITLSLMKYN